MEYSPEMCTDASRVRTQTRRLNLKKKKMGKIISGGKSSLSSVFEGPSSVLGLADAKGMRCSQPRNGLRNTGLSMA